MKDLSTKEFNISRKRFSGRLEEESITETIGGLYNWYTGDHCRMIAFPDTTGNFSNNLQGKMIIPRVNVNDIHDENIEYILGILSDSTRNKEIQSYDGGSTVINSKKPYVFFVSNGHEWLNETDSGMALLRYVGFAISDYTYGSYIIMLNGEDNNVDNVFDAKFCRDLYWDILAKKRARHGTPKQTLFQKYVTNKYLEKIEQEPQTFDYYSDLLGLSAIENDLTIVLNDFNPTSSRNVSDLIEYIASKGWSLKVNHIQYNLFASIPNIERIKTVGVSGEDLITLYLVMREYEHVYHILFEDRHDTRSANAISHDFKKEVKTMLSDGFKQKDIAQKLNVSPATISRVAKDIRKQEKKFFM